MNAPPIRRAAHSDLDEIVELGAAFHAYGPYAFVPMDRSAFRGFCASLIDGGIIFLSEEGMLGGLLNPLYFNRSVVMAAELFWWAPKGGRALRIAFEEWAQDQGAIGVQFSGLEDERAPVARKLFQRAGYHPTETGYVKVFS